MHNRLAVFTVAARPARRRQWPGRPGDRCGTAARDARADALGGRDRVMALKTLQIVGYGELAYFNGGGNITGDPAAPQKWQKVLEYTPDDRSRALAHARAAAPEDGFRLRVDGRAARAQSDQRNARRRCRLQHRRRIPGGSSDRDAAATACRRRGRPPAPRGAARPSDHDRPRGARSGEQAVESAETGEPAARRRHRASGRHADAGGECDVESSRVGQLRRPERQPRGRHAIEPQFVGYVPEKGVQLPTGFATTIDFRNVVQSKLYVDRNIVDEPIDDLSAPASVRSPRRRRARPAEAARTCSR